MRNENAYIDTRKNVEQHLQELYTLVSQKECQFDILLRKKGEPENDPFTTENTMLTLGYGSEDIKRELSTLEVSDYIENVKDDKHTDSPDFRVFGKEIQGYQVYIKEKIRLSKKIFCVSFHFARFPLKQRPYDKED